MSKNSDFELDLDLQLLPEWARQAPTVNRYAKYEGSEGDDPRRSRSGPGFRRGGGGRPDRGGAPRREGGPPRGDRQDRGGPRQGRGGPGDDRGPGGGRRFDRRPPREEIPLPEVDVSIVPEEAGVGSLAHQIKLTGRAYPLFDIASLILQRRERYHIVLGTTRGAEGKVAQPLFLCSLDDSVWFTEEEVATHVLAKHFDTLYQTDRVPTDPPKGTYTLVAQCPVSGVILGPPNLHDYNQKLRKLHADRFARMPFEAYKARIRMVTDEAVVKQWVEEQSFKNEFTCLNVPEPLKLGSREEVMQHFRETHLPGLARGTDKHTFPAAGDWPAMPHDLRTLVGRIIDDQRRFPLKVAMVLSQQFARHGLQFFKVNKTVTHVCVARPHFLDLENTVVSDGVRSIVDYIRVHDRCTRRELLESLAPTPPAKPEPAPVEPAEAAAAAPEAPAPIGTAPEPTTEPATGTDAGAAATDAPAAEEEPQAKAGPEPAKAPAAPQPTREQAAVIADLHWLIHQGHVIEFTSGKMELAKRPQPKPVKPKQKPKPAAAPETKPSAQTEATATKPAAPAAEATPGAVTSATGTLPAAPAETASAPTPKEPTPAATPAGAAPVQPAEPVAPAETIKAEPPAKSETSSEPPASKPVETTRSEAEDLSASTAEVMGSAPAVPAAPAEGAEAETEEKPPQP